jgi:prepilin-type N-terminal cleavage/methylation domain-containing protein
MWQGVKKAFTLLEIMIAILLIAMASGLIAMKLYPAIEKKKFSSDLERLKCRLFTAQKLAMTMQADWKGILKKESSGWVFTVECEGQEGKRLAPLHLSKMDISLNQKNISSELAFDFFASGHFDPVGVFSFSFGPNRASWENVELFQREEGKKLGPIHP